MHHRSHLSNVVRPLCAALAVALVLPFVTPLAALADDDQTPVAGAGVARLSVTDGSVAIQRGDANATVAAVVNAPILGADFVTTGPQSRAEVQFDGKTVVRLGDNVQMRFARVDNGNRQIQLAAGTIELRLLRGTDGTSAIDTPSISIVPRASGSYRIAVGDDGATFVTVRVGRADIVTPQGTQALAPGSTLIAQGTAADPQINTRDAIAFDSFDAFNDDRDRVQLAALANSPYVDTDIGGVADLGAYGNWVADGSYGHVWIPTAVPAGWAPYRTGSWVWEDGYGWTWVAVEPWGWAPYHYGRWYFSSAYNRWAWYPPAPAPFAPAWSPALVGFVGLSFGAVSVGFAFGSHVGWVPLAPYEAFHPWWGPHPAPYVQNVSYTNVNVSINAVYRNAQYDGVSSVSYENFRVGRFGTATAVTTAQLAGARPVPLQGALPVVPTASNLRFTSQSANGSVPPAHAVTFAPHAFAGSAAVAPRTPFAEQQANVARVTGAPSYAQPQGYAHTVQPPEPQAPSYARSSAGYAQPSYAQPGYAAPAYAQPSHAQPAYPHPSYEQQPAQQRPQPTYTYRGYVPHGAPPARPHGESAPQHGGRSHD